MKTLFLHCMSNLATSEVSLPTLFFATHRYSPLSVLLTLVMFNCVLFVEKLILKSSLVFTGDPFSVHEIVSTGLPTASQDRVIFSPSVTIYPCGWTVIDGFSVKKQRKIMLWCPQSSWVPEVFLLFSYLLNDPLNHIFYRTRPKKLNAMSLAWLYECTVPYVLGRKVLQKKKTILEEITPLFFVCIFNVTIIASKRSVLKRKSSFCHGLSDWKKFTC